MNMVILFLMIFFLGFGNGDIESINGRIGDAVSYTEIEVRGYGIVDVTFETSDGVTIKGTYYNASNENAARIILLHMLSRNREDWHEFARDLQAAGYGVLAIDMRGHGESGLDYRDFAPGEDFKNMVKDIAAAKEYLIRDGVSGDNIAIIGASIGANVALNYAAGDEDIKALVLLSPGLNYRGIETEDAMVAYGERPVFLIASEGDPYCADTCEVLYSIASGDARIKIYQSDAHGTWIVDSQHAGPMIIDWMEDVT